MSFNQPGTIMLIAAFISLLLSIYAWQKKQNITGIYLSLLLLSSAIWALFYGLEILSSHLLIMKIYLFISYFGITSLPVFWLLFASRYTGTEKWINNKTLILVFTIPVLSILMHATNHFHSLFYTSVTLGEIDNINYLKLEPGIFWWINIVYSHIVTIAGLILFVQLMFKLEKGQRIPIVFFVSGALIPYVVNVLYISGVRPYGFLDLTPMAFILMGFVIIFGVFTVKLFDISPLAVDLFFRNTPDIIFVRNSQGNIVNQNPAAQRLMDDLGNFNKNDKNSGVLDEMIFNETPGLSELKILGKYYEKTVTKISNRKAVNIGTLILLRDVSKAREAQEEIEKLANLQNLLMRMASNYINLKIDDIEEGISQSLCEIGTYAEADRAYIFDYDWEKNTCSNTYEWCADGISKEIDNLQDIPVSILPDWTTAHKRGEPLIIPDVYQLPEDNAVRQILEPQRIKSLITIPVMHKSVCNGFIGFDFVKKYRVIKEYERILLSVYAEILVNLLGRATLENNLIKEKVNANAANKAKSEFLANMSHEIRTPMNSILGFAEVMINTTTDKQQITYLNTILESGKALLSLINDILDLSKIESGQMNILSEPVDLRIIINEIKNLFSHKMKEKNLDFLTEIDSDLPQSIIIDELRIRQILLNLVGNAIKFTNEGYVKVQVKVTAIKSGSLDFEISVIDTGIGIEGGIYNHLFDAFIQQSGQNNRKYEGTGLGLAITKRLVELLNGDITVESTPGKGSNFTVIFKKIVTSQLTISKPDSYSWSNKIISFLGAKILIVDDIQHNRSLVSAYLNKYNCTIIEAEDGEDAVNKALIYLPAIILMDIRMPHMDGYEATRLIKSNPLTKEIPVLALTASTMKDEVYKLIEVFDSYILKPVHKQILINELTRFIPFSELKVIDENKNITTRNELIYVKEINSEIKKLFKKEFADEISLNLESIIVDDIRNIISKLEDFAAKHKIAQLEKLSDDLKTYLSDFDFENIKYTLNAIKTMFGVS